MRSNFRLRPERTWSGFTVIESNTDFEIGTREYHNRQDNQPRYELKIYGGKRNTPDHYVVYRTEEARAAAITKYKESIESHKAWKDQKKESRKLLANPVEVGQVYVSSWGYDQTNVDFYQVTEVKGHFAILREIGCKAIVKPGYSDMADHVVADKDAFLDKEPIRKKILTDDGGKTAYFQMSSFETASLDHGEQHYRSWYA